MRANGFLVKVATTARDRAPDRPIAGAGLELQELFEVSPSRQRTAIGADQRQVWYRIDGGAGGLGLTSHAGDAWEQAHEIAGRSDLGFLGGGHVLAVEPDFEQNIYPGSQQRRSAFSADRPNPAEPEAQEGNPYAEGAGFAWHLGDEFSGLGRARAGIERSDIKIVHLDTGFDPTHRAAPEHVLLTLQKNFVEGGDDARDQTPEDGFFTQRGHGTGTLGILAGRTLDDVKPPEANGQTLGGAAAMKIIPVRIADRVLHFRTSTVAQGLAYACQIEADVVSMSMGGLPSTAWADAINDAYDRGLVVVCAAGNNFGGLPTGLIVYPARFQRVIAACGVMGDGRPYTDLPSTHMQGNIGPAGKMRTALAAFTPNIPWARLGNSQIIDLDGGGTSAATPQIAAAAALWLHHNGGRFQRRDWRRAEAARQALFRTARGGDHNRPDARLGWGRLDAAAAMKWADLADLRREPEDTAEFAFLRLLSSWFGLGVRDQRPGMMALELTQLALQSKQAQQAIADPDGAPEAISMPQRRAFLEAILAEGKASDRLRSFLSQALGRSRPAPTAGIGPASPPAPLVDTRRPLRAPPPTRRLRIFATDPGGSRRLQTAFINTATVAIPWETAPENPNLLQPGPIGEYLEVMDIDPASRLMYAPVDLNDPFLLAQDGHAPSEGNPQFHQQMVYAVAMRTIVHFEAALGRRVLWARRRMSAEDGFVRRLRIYPHALRQANAFYSPDRVALLFGYFRAGAGRRQIFTCLSHDIVAHETSHALLDGLHRRYQEGTNPDVLALHEAFSDIVAIFQHFTFPELLRFEIGQTRGDLSVGELMAGLAREFGEAVGHTRALRSAIGISSDPAAYEMTEEPHDRGAILVAAVFDAFLAIYARRTEDLLRIATNGTGVLQPGALGHDLAARLADEAAKTARHVLTICIRALDYMPPVDPTFPEYLRAIVTADSDLIPDDRYGYRIAFLEAFSSRGILPDDLRSLSIESLRWQTLREDLQPPGMGDFIRKSIDLSWDLRGDRHEAYRAARGNAARLHEWLECNLDEETARALGLDRRPPGDADPDPFASRRDEHGRPLFEVHAVRPARRATPDGQVRTDIVALITQRRTEEGVTIRSGCTLLLDRREGMPPIRYAIVKPASRQRTRHVIENAARSATLHSTYFGEHGGEPFAALHGSL